VRATESRPAANGAATSSAGRHNDADTVPPEPAASYLTGALAVLVSTPRGRFRRRLYLSLSAAEKCAERARIRGEEAHIVLVQLHAVGPVGGGRP
jgi:hypothetical protein